MADFICPAKTTGHYNSKTNLDVFRNASQPILNRKKPISCMRSLRCRVFVGLNFSCLPLSITAAVIGLSNHARL